MSRHQTSFKATQVFDWDLEPTAERPTDFGASTGFSALSGYYAVPQSRIKARRRRELRRGLIKLALTGAVILCLCAIAVREVSLLLA